MSIEPVRNTNSEKEYWYGGEEFGALSILVVGCGNSGCSTVGRLSSMGIEGARTVAVNTDRHHLALIEADLRVLVGQSLTKGLGAGGDPDLARKAGERSRLALERALEGADLVFVTAGLGGGAGTGIAPLACQMAGDAGATVMGIFSLPFRDEEKQSVALDGVDALKEASDTLVLFDDERILDLAPELSREQAFSVMDQLAAEIVRSITETLTLPSLINLDFADVRTIMRNGGLSTVLVGEGRVEEAAEELVRSALKNSLMYVDREKATGCLLHVTGGADLSLEKAAAIASTLIEELDPQANVIWGARVKGGCEGRIGLMAIITGVGSIPAGSERPEDT